MRLFPVLALAVSLAATASSLPAQAPPARLTLAAAVEAALEENPEMAAARATTAAAAAGVREARALWLPRVDGSAAVTRSDNPVFVFGSLLEQGRFAQQHFDPGFLNDPEPLTNYRLGLNVRYTLFDRFRRFRAGPRARNVMDQAGQAEDEARQKLRADAIARFYAVVLAEEKRRVAVNAVASGESAAESMRARFDEGLIVESDLLAAQVQLASFRQQLIEAEGDVAIARAALAVLMHRPALDAMVVEATIPESAPQAAPLDEAIALALERRGILRSAERGAANAALQLQISRASLLPRVDAFAGWGSSGSSLAGGDPDTTAGIVIGIDLFDRGRPARIAAARAAVDMAHAAEAGARSRVTMEVITAWHRAHASRERIGLAISAAGGAASAARIVSDRHGEGLTTITEQLRAQTALVSAQLELLSARYAAVVGYAELLRSTGGLNDIQPFQ